MSDLVGVRIGELSRRVGVSTELLRAWSAGDQGAFDALVPVVYSELKRLAER